MRARTAAVIAAALITAVAGCGDSNPSRPPPAIGPATAVASPDRIHRPIDRYTLNVADAKILHRGAQIAIADCMRRFGFPPEPGPAADMAAAAAQVRSRSAVYGFFAPQTVTQDGYGAHRTLPPEAAVPAPADQTEVLQGVLPDGTVATTYHGMPLPKGGCIRAGLAEVGGVPPLPLDTSPLPDHGPQVPPTDPRLTAVDAKWSTCMADRGYHYATPVDAIADPTWRASRTTTPAEIATATADIACKQATNLVGITVAIEAAYDDQYISSHTDALRAYDRTLRADVQKAAAILVGDGSPTRG